MGCVFPLFQPCPRYSPRQQPQSISTARTIQRLMQKIQAFIEGEALADFQKIDVILNASNNHTKDGTSKACLQIWFRVFHRCRWVDSDYGPGKLNAILSPSMN
ncbi:hypothetical protein BGZ79_007297 [Entomortierella chlamydospora]|nr:hypothetical protein BGZ79_007297 [Entomortierella chlamydospora]